MTDYNRFLLAYEGAPPWAIGRPQAEVIRLEETGAFRGRVLDVGCGTGHNAIHLASRGHDVLGVDLVPRAIEIARTAAKLRNVEVRFEVRDARHLEGLGSFDSALDAGVFHIFDDEDRAAYVAALGSVLGPGAHLHVIVFSDEEPAEWGGPRRVTKRELEHAFQDGWHVRAIDAARYETMLPAHEATAGGHAWHATIERG